MKSNPIRFVRDSRGQSLIEFALILPMMLVVMFMITEFGRALYTYNVLATAARAGARAAVVAGSQNFQTRGGDRANQILHSANLDNNGFDVKFVVEDNFNGSTMKVVKCTVTRPFTWVISKPVPVNAGAASQTVSTSGLNMTAVAFMKTETF
jgi:Flp pilus assembly protein TadG